MASMKKTRIMSTLLLLSCLCAWSASGWCMTTTATSQSITIPITQWNELKSESKELSAELIEYRKEIQLLKKPSSELVTQLTQAEKMLSQLQTELSEQKKDLMELSKDKDELRTLSLTLKQQIGKERSIHRRQLWQNRLWCILGGAAVGIAIGHASK